MEYMVKHFDQWQRMKMANKTFTEKMWKLSNEGQAEWWPNNQHGHPIIKQEIDGNLSIYLPGYAVYCGSQGDSYWQQFADDLVEINLKRWVLQHEYQFDYDCRQEGWVSCCHGHDVFGDDLVELMEYIQENNL